MNRLQYLLELHGIFMCIAAIVSHFQSRRKEEKETRLLIWVILINALILFWDIMAYSQQGVATAYGFTMHVVANFFLYGLEYLMCCLMARYIYLVLLKYTGKDYKWMPTCAIAITGVLFVLLICNLFIGCYYYFDEDNFYHRGPLFLLNTMPQLLLMVVFLYFVLKYRRQLPRRMFIAMQSFFSFPVVGLLLQNMFFGFSFFNVATAISVCFFWVVTVEQNFNDRRKQEEILFQTQTSLLGAQMSPHFIFNALSSIGYLMDEDVDAAHQALLDFSNYLRKTIDINPQQGLVTLETEMEFVEEYVAIEKLRFGDMLEIITDIEDSGVKIPYLTIEPLVENAIKHGIRKRMGKGTVVIRSRREKREIVIEVIDDGIGFETDHLDEKEASRIGINNVRERIRLFCKGTMQIHSEVGSGTRVEIRIPAEE